LPHDGSAKKKGKSTWGALKENGYPNFRSKPKVGLGSHPAELKWTSTGPKKPRDVGLPHGKTWSTCRKRKKKNWRIQPFWHTHTTVK